MEYKIQYGKKSRPGMKQKRLTLYACQICDGRGWSAEPPRGFEPIDVFGTAHKCTNPNCKAGIHKRVISCFEKDFYKKMEIDRKKAGMVFRGSK